MAAASQCDICKKTYPLYNTNKDREKTNGLMFVNRDMNRKYWSHDIMDLCPECMDSLKKYLESLKKESK